MGNCPSSWAEGQVPGAASWLGCLERVLMICPLDTGQSVLSTAQPQAALKAAALIPAPNCEN